MQNSSRENVQFDLDASAFANDEWRIFSFKVPGLATGRGRARTGSARAVLTSCTRCLLRAARALRAALLSAPACCPGSCPAPRPATAGSRCCARRWWYRSGLRGPRPPRRRLTARFTSQPPWAPPGQALPPRQAALLDRCERAVSAAPGRGLGALPPWVGGLAAAGAAAVPPPPRAAPCCQVARACPKLADPSAPRPPTLYPAECPFAHPGEKARRRDPRRYRYSGTACPEYRRVRSHGGSCMAGACHAQWRELHGSSCMAGAACHAVHGTSRMAGRACGSSGGAAPHTCAWSRRTHAATMRACMRPVCAEPCHQRSKHAFFQTGACRRGDACP